MAPDATTYRLVEGHGLLICHFGERLRLLPGQPVRRSDDEVAALPLAA